MSDLYCTYQQLVSAYIKDNDALSAFQAIELIRAKFQIEMFFESEKDKKKQERRLWPQDIDEIKETWMMIL